MKVKTYYEDVPFPGGRFYTTVSFYRPEQSTHNGLATHARPTKRQVRALVKDTRKFHALMCQQGII